MGKAGHLVSSGADPQPVATVGAGPAKSVCATVLVSPARHLPHFDPESRGPRRNRRPRCDPAGGSRRHGRKLLFWDKDPISRLPVLATAHLRLAPREQGGPWGQPRPFNDLLWSMFTGDSPDLATLRKVMSPGLWGSLPLEVPGAFFQRLGKRRAIARKEV